MEDEIELRPATPPPFRRTNPLFMKPGQDLFADPPSPVMTTAAPQEKNFNAVPPPIDYTPKNNDASLIANAKNGAFQKMSPANDPVGQLGRQGLGSTPGPASSGQNITPHFAPQRGSKNTFTSPKGTSPSVLSELSGSVGSIAVGNVAGAAVGGIFNIGSSLINASATRYAADQQLAGIKYQTDASYAMWDRDYKIANQMGLYHPSQLAGMNNGAGTVYKLGARGLNRVQMTKGKSPFG